MLRLHWKYFDWRQPIYIKRPVIIDLLLCSLALNQIKFETCFGRLDFSFRKISKAALTLTALINCTISHNLCFLSLQKWSQTCAPPAMGGIVRRRCRIFAGKTYICTQSTLMFIHSGSLGILKSMGSDRV